MGAMADGLTLEERLRRALDLADFAEAVQRSNLKRRFPDDDDAQHEARVVAWRNDKPMMSGRDLRTRQ